MIPTTFRYTTHGRLAAVKAAHRFAAVVRTLLHDRLMLLMIALAVVAVASAPAAELDAPPPGTFTVVVIPDTQGYRGRATKATPQSVEPLTNPVFENHTHWIAENLKTQNIVFVSHVGDIVDINNAEQWALARTCLDRLHGVVPYGLTVGNHDMTTRGDATLYQQQFPAERFREFPWYGGSYTHARKDQNVSANNVNSFQVFSAGGMDFVHLNIECNAPDDVLAWADGVLKQHAKRRALVTTHMDLGPVDKPKTNEGYVADPKGRMAWVKIHGSRGNTSVQLWEKLFSKHANIAFIFSGDQSRTVAMKLAAKGEAGNTVHSLLSDYTSSGPLRLYRFIPSENRVVVITYDTTKRVLVDTMKNVPDKAEHQFEVAYRMR